MNKVQEKTWKKIQELFENSELEEIETPGELDWNCGSCMGDRGHNETYYTTAYMAGEYVLVSNSCQDYLIEDGEKVNFSSLHASELKALLLDVKKEINMAEEKEAKETAALEKELSA